TSAVLSSDLADRLHVKKGDAITLKGPNRSRSFTIQSIAEGQNTSWVGVDIAAAQELLDRYGTVDRIEVFLDPGEDLDGVGLGIRRVVPVTYDVQTPGARSE